MTIGTDESDFDRFEDGDCWNCDCWNCDGEGFVANCQDEIACMYPDDGCDLCMRRCEYCNPTRTASSERTEP